VLPNGRKGPVMRRLSAVTLALVSLLVLVGCGHTGNQVVHAFIKQGRFTLFFLPSVPAGCANCFAEGITSGPDHALWFTERLGPSLAASRWMAASPSFSCPTLKVDRVT
jgi:hypothetical protein